MTLSGIFYPYHFVRTILPMPFCPISFCPYTILSIPFCPYHFVRIPFCPCHFVRYHFVRSPLIFFALCSTSIFTWLTPGKLKEFCRSHADLSYSFSAHYSELRSSQVFSKRSSVIISKAPD